MSGRLTALRARARYVLTTGARRRVRDTVVGLGPQDRFVVREDLARAHLRGDGIEIGAATHPLRVPATARVRYVDRLTKAEFVRDYGHILERINVDPSAMPETDVVDSADSLGSFADGELDFVVANHVLEHLEDPVRALRAMTRVLKPGGVLFLTLPDPRFSFDDGRERTTVAHVLADHEHGPHTSRRQHYEEWARAIEGASTDERVEELASEYARTDARHHFHVWELDTFLDLVRALDLPCRTRVALQNAEELAVLLERVSAGDTP